MKHVRALVRKEWQMELKQKHTLLGVLLYVLTTVFTCYLTMDKVESASTWSALVWVTGVFAAFNAMQKVFFSEPAGVQLWLYTLVTPRTLILAKMLYHGAVVAALQLLSMVAFIFFFGMGGLERMDWGQLTLVMLLGSAGLGITLTFVSSLAYKSGGGIGLIAILGFPLIIPMLTTMSRATTFAVIGAPWEQNELQMVILLGLNAMSWVLAYVLFPYLWRE
ncbi:MAG: heme exporter protein CcmB [Flavobacteriales bacterium]